jgi:hypothetical protein
MLSRITGRGTLEILPGRSSSSPRSFTHTLRPIRSLRFMGLTGIVAWRVKPTHFVSVCAFVLGTKWRFTTGKLGDQSWPVKRSDFAPVQRAGFFFAGTEAKSNPWPARNNSNNQTRSIILTVLPLSSQGPTPALARFLCSRRLRPATAGNLEAPRAHRVSSARSWGILASRKHRKPPQNCSEGVISTHETNSRCNRRRQTGFSRSTHLGGPHARAICRQVGFATFLQ